jgi:hypothetical protein
MLYHLCLFEKGKYKTFSFAKIVVLWPQMGDPPAFTADAKWLK